MRRIFALTAVGCLLLAGCTERAGTATPATAATDAPQASSDATGDVGGVTVEATPGDAGLVPVQAGVATLSPENTKIMFVGTHAGGDPNPRTGEFGKFSGVIKTSGDAKALESIATEIDAASLTAEVGQKLTNHLKNEDFLDVRQHPNIAFQSTKIEKQSDGSYHVTGDLTLHGTTKSIELPATASFGETGLNLKAEFTIDRTEFGMDRLLNNVEKEVKITVAVGGKTEPHQAAAGPGGGRGRSGAGGNFNPDEFFARRDANGDGKLTGDEISDRLRENLAETDSNGDGEVSKDEFVARMRQFAGRGPGGGNRQDGSDGESETSN